MGLMDKVKAQATQLAQKTQEAAQEGKSRLDQAQASRRGDALLRQLGVLVFAERTGRGAPDSQAKIDELISTISAHEQENGLNLAQPTVPPPASPGSQPGPNPGPNPGAQAGPPPPGPPPPGPASGGPGGPSQDVPGGFATGQTFFPPPGDS